MIYEHSHALRRTAFEQKILFCKESFVRHRRKKITEFATMARCTNNVEDL